MNDILLTVSGRLGQIASDDCPRRDYLEMAAIFGADLIDYAKARGESDRFGRILERIGGPNLLLAWACFQQRHRYRLIFTDGEQIGIPLALLLKFLSLGHRTPRHFMISHILSVGKKLILLDWLRLHTHINLFFVYSSWQKQFIERRWGISAERVILTPFQVDAHFFSPAQVVDNIRPQLDLGYPDRPIICAAGLEFRDYPTLIHAVENLEVQLVIAAASPWSKRSDSTKGYTLPDNVLVQKFSQSELRQLYAACEFVAMPLYNINFQAGVTAILEALAMEKAIICTQTPGQTDVIKHNETGYYVPPGDAHTWRDAIEHLLNNPDEARRMGKNGRQLILNQMSLDKYVERLNRFVQES